MKVSLSFDKILRTTITSNGVVRFAFEIIGVLNA
jgi:hypothetical protein